MASEVKSPISGVVWRVDAAAGAQVAEGQAVVTLESMKMEVPVEAPRSGKVIELKVAKGDFVEEGQVIALLG